MYTSTIDETRTWQKYPLKALLKTLTLFRPGLFWSSGGWGGRIPPPPLNSENIKAMTTKLEGQIVRPQMFPLRSATLAVDVYDVTITFCSQTAAILDPPSWIS